MQQQTFTVAVIVVVTFGAGFFFGRTTAPSTQPPPAPTAQVPNFAPAAQPAPSAPFMRGSPPMAPMAGESAPGAGASGTTVSGTIAEVIQVPNFTYLRLTTANGEEWAAVSANEQVKVGQAVKLASANLMEQFPSKTLNRTFERIWFGELAP